MMLKNKIIHLSFATALLVSCSSSGILAPVSDSTFHVTQAHLQSTQNQFHTVKKGETLYSIAFNYGIDFRELAQINNIDQQYLIYPGQKLSLKQVSTVSKKSRQKKNISKKKMLARAKKKSRNSRHKDRRLKNNDKSTTNSQAKQVYSKVSSIRTWVWPTDGKVIETYSPKPQGNKGIDIAGRKGQPVRAAADGIVVYSGTGLRGYGKLVIIKHNDLFLSAYAHNEKIFVKEKEIIKAGQAIADIGDSGTDKVKLHFEIRYKGKPVNPLTYLPKL